MLCGADFIANVFYKDNAGLEKQCQFNVVVECNNIQDTINCSFDGPILLYNGEDNFLVKVIESENSTYYLINESRNGITHIKLTKVDKNTKSTWTYTSGPNIAASDFIIEGSLIYIVGGTRPAEAGNNSVFIKLSDNGSNFSAISSEIITLMV